MPEGDTVWRTARRLHEALAGQPLVAADLRWPGISTADLRGMTVVAVAARGKHILTRFDSGWTLHSHLRMEGQWRIDPSSRWPDPALDQRGPRDDVRAVLVAPEWTAVGLRLGMLDLVRTVDEHTLIGHLGPDILDPAFDVSLAVANLAADDSTIGAALLDQRNLAGIGTLWSSESLFLERLHPWQPASDVPAATFAGLVERARRLIRVNCDYAVQSSTGDRRAGHTSYVHARSGHPCRRCGGTVRVASIGPPTRERPMFYCPGCQGGLSPTDEGRPAAPLGARRRQPPAQRLS